MQKDHQSVVMQYRFNDAIYLIPTKILYYDKKVKKDL